MANQKKRKPGRPKLPKGEAMGKIVPVRFTAAEIKRVTAEAKMDDMTVSEWIREAVGNYLSGRQTVRVVC